MKANRVRAGMIVAMLMAASMAVGAEPVELTLRADRPLVEAGASRTVRVMVGVAGRELPAADRPPVNLAIVIDKSGSMSGERIASARRGAIEAIRRLGRDDVVSLIAFDNHVHILRPAQELTAADAVERIVERIEAGGSTNIHGGLTAAQAELRKHLEKGHLNRVVLLSDGLANVGPSQPDDFAALGRTLARDGVVVSTVGVGLNYNEHLLASLAQASEGNNYFVSHPAVLPEIFQEEIGNLVSTVATGVTITIELPEGVVLKDVLGRDHRSVDEGIEIDFHDLAGGAAKYSVLELTVPAGEAGEAMEALRASVRYRRTGDERVGEASAGARISYTESREAADAAVDVDVQHAWVELHQAAVQEEVVAMAERGDRDAARQRLQGLSNDAARAGIAPEAARRLAEFADREDGILEHRGYSRHETLQRRTEAYQSRVQQSTGRVQIDDPAAEQPSGGYGGGPEQRQTADPRLTPNLRMGPPF